MKINMTPKEMLNRGKALEAAINKLGYNAKIDADKMMSELCNPESDYHRIIVVSCPEITVKLTVWNTGECEYNVHCHNYNTLFELSPSKHKRIMRAGAGCIVDNSNYESYAYGLSSQAFRMLLNNMYNM